MCNRQEGGGVSRFVARFCEGGLCARLRIGLAVLLGFAAMTVHAVGDGVYRFWWNQGDATDGEINGVEDRENFFPLLLDIGQFVSAWGNGGVSFRLRGNGAVNVAFTSMSRDDVWALYRSDEVLAGENFSQTIDAAAVTQITSAGIDIPQGVIARIRAGQDVVLACEVRPGANAGVVQFEAVAGGSVLCRFPMGCYASDVKDMYHWINLRHVSGQAETDPTMTAPPSNAYWGDELPHVFFIHGANVDEAASRIWCEKMFKRLYLSGAWMKFHGVSWRSQVAGASDYHLNASNSFEVASSLAAVVNACQGRKVVIAHSLGTMLTANAIQFFGMQVDKVIFLNSAIPSEALDVSKFSAEATNPLVHDDWRSYPTNCWTSLFHTLAPSNTDRSRLTWKNRFPLVATNLFNMYSSGDEVLSISTAAAIPAGLMGSGRRVRLGRAIRGRNRSCGRDALGYWRVLARRSGLDGVSSRTDGEFAYGVRLRQTQLPIRSSSQRTPYSIRIRFRSRTQFLPRQKSAPT